MTIALVAALTVLFVIVVVLMRLLVSARALGTASPEASPMPLPIVAEQRSLAMAPPYHLVSGRHGWMLGNVNDVYLGQALLKYGECCEIEVDFLKRLCALRPGALLEIGANVGTHTVPLALHLAAQGRGLQVFEPQPFIFQNLCANLALNAITNVLAWPYACGEKAGVVRFDRPDYIARGNFGGVEMSAEPDADGISAPCVVLDEFLGKDAVALMKVDVEGFELQVLRGAERTIDTHRPVLYVENDRAEKSHDLIEWLWKKDYRLWWHFTPLFNPDNFFADRQNVYGEIVSFNMLCLPREMESSSIGLEPIEVNHHPLLGPAPDAARAANTPEH